MPRLVIDLPPSVPEQEARLILVLALYKQGHISLGKAAEMAGYPLREFMRLASERGVAVINYDPSDLSHEMLG
jgi:predicted HTH domain antitoxin